MARYKIVYKKPAVKSIQKLPPQIKKRLKVKIEFFLNQDNSLVFAKVFTKPTDAMYRFRIGNYRVLFDVCLLYTSPSPRD